MVLMYYSYYMAFEFLAIEKEEKITTEKRIFGKISLGKCLKAGEIWIGRHVQECQLERRTAWKCKLMMQCPFFILHKIEWFWSTGIFQLHLQKRNRARDNWKLTSKAEYLRNCVQKYRLQWLFGSIC